MLRKAGCIFATVIAAVFFHSASLQAKLAHPASSTAITPSQEPGSKQIPQNPQDKIVINTKLVNITVSVNDKLGRFVAGLEKKDFEIFDDNIKQDIAFFSDDDAPISLGIVYTARRTAADIQAGSCRICSGRMTCRFMP